MTALLLATVLNLGAGVQLAGSDRPVRLIVDEQSLEEMSREQLEVELVRLHASRPALVWPIIFIPVGAIAAGTGLALLNVGAALVFSRPALVASFLIGGGAVLLLGGVVLAIVGIVRLGRRLAERREINVEVEAIERRLESLDRLSRHDWVSANNTVLGTF